MAQVKKELIEITGLSVNAPLVVDGGANGSYAVAAHQIKWGNSEFNGKTFGGTSYGLLTAIEGAIADSANSANTSAGSALTRAEQAYSYASYVGSIADQAYEAAYNAKGSIDTFLNGEGLAYTVDTLKDIQDYIKTHGSEASNMLTSINDAKERANASYSYAGSAFARANEAYNHAGDAANTAQANAYSKADTVRNEAYYYVNTTKEELTNRLTTTITSTSNTDSTGVTFVGGISIQHKDNNNFELVVSYYTPKAEDYWGVYEPSI